MTYKWQERRAGKRQGLTGHVTEAQNLDEAIGILQIRTLNEQRSAAMRSTARTQKRSLKQIFSSGKLSASVRASNQKRPKQVKLPDPYACETIEQRDAMIRQMHAGGYWNVKDLSKQFHLRHAEIYEIIERANPANP